MPATIAAPAAAAPAAPSTPAPVTPKNGAVTEPGQPPATDPKVNAKPNNEPGAKPGETPAETRQRMKLKLRKLDGPGEDELELDETEIGRYVQKARVADKNRAADDAARAEWQAKVDAALKDPVGYFRERGVDLVELGKQEAARAEELAKLDPVQRELAETRQQLQKYEAEKAELAKKAEADAEAAAHQRLVQSEAGLLNGAADASGRLGPPPPKDAPEAVKRAYLAQRGYLWRLYSDVRELAEYADVPLTPQQLAAAGDKLEMDRLTGMTKRVSSSPQWRAKNMTHLKELISAVTSGMEGDALVDFFGTKEVDRLSRAALGKYRKNPLPVVAPDITPQQTEPRAPRQASNDDGESLMGMMDRIAGR